jgi:hypothetical protein
LLPSNFFYSGFYFSGKKAKECLQKGAFQHNFNPQAPMVQPACLLVSMQGKMAESIHPQTEKHAINQGVMRAAVLKGELKEWRKCSNCRVRAPYKMLFPGQSLDYFH